MEMEIWYEAGIELKLKYTMMTMTNDDEYEYDDE